jgi:O-antigen/teichoic acid export membrane protein
MLTKLKTLKNHTGFIRYFKNTSWMMAEQFLRIIAGLFVGIWVARYLGPEQFGLFSYALAFTAIFGGVAKLGLDGIMVRELIKHPEKTDTYLGTAFWLKILGAFLVMGIMAAIIPFTSNDATTNLFILIIAAGLVFQSFEVVEFFFQSQVLAKIVSICKVLQLTLSSIIKIYLVLSEAELIYFVLVTAFDALSLAISYFIAYKLRKNPVFYKHYDFSIAKQLLKDSWPLIFTAIFTMLYARIDQIMIKEMLGEYEVGLYSASIRLTEAWLFVPVIISASLFPAIVAAKNISQALYEERLMRLYTLIVVIGFIVCLLTTAFSEFILRLLFGVAFVEGSSVLAIRVWETLFAAIGVVSSKWIIAENLQSLTVKIIIAGALINVLLNYLTIPVWGIEGAAFASLISIIFTVIILPFLIKKLRGNVVFRINAIFFIGLYRLMNKK